MHEMECLCAEDYDPWMVGSLLLGVMLLLALIALLIVLLYILCYKRKNTTVIEELPAVTYLLT